MKQVGLRFLFQGTFFQTITTENEGKAIIKTWTAMKCHGGPLNPGDDSWVVDLEKVAAIHLIPLEELQPQPVEQQKPASVYPPWLKGSGVN